MRPVLIFLIGSAGSGKSTIGKRLAAEHHLCYLDKDVVCNTFTGKLLEARGYSPHERDGNAYYRDIVMDLEYETLLNVANDNLQLGRSVILDAPFVGYFHKSDYINQLISKYEWREVIPVVLRVDVNVEVLQQRLRNRGLERDRWKLDHWDSFVEGMQANICKWENIELITVDNSSEECDLRHLMSILPLSAVSS
ncbi:ATP-binding protein [Paenibacillus sp. 7516]|uniref:AAA family ATPase n=1 Tax=Paenibacillus sp. 7516 TaxID=2022549 RepID=UPI000BA5E800|nr:ATP-binding protein [Paenibacillus sp. 7516]PAF29716.1 shikimate kinase [Paenibacillus sp. 7516]